MTAASTSSSSSSSQLRSPEEIIRWLGEERLHPTRKSALVVEYGTYLLERGYIKRLGDDLWSTLEQIAIAALDIGNFELAELCLSRLNTRFPKSSRVATLQGMVYEGRGEYTRALHYYDALIEKSEGADIMLYKRRIATLKAADTDGKYTKAIEALVTHTEIFYSDPEAWQELAGLYLETGQMSKALSALEELMLLVPQNSFYVLQYAEAQYTAENYVTAYKCFLRVLDLAGVIEEPEATSPAKAADERGPVTRALMGLQVTIARLRENPSKATSSTPTPSGPVEMKADSLDLVEQLASDLLLNRVYGAEGGTDKARDGQTLKALRKATSDGAF